MLKLKEWLNSRNIHQFEPIAYHSQGYVTRVLRKKDGKTFNIRNTFITTYYGVIYNYVIIGFEDDKIRVFVEIEGSMNGWININDIP